MAFESSNSYVDRPLVQKIGEQHVKTPTMKYLVS
jgi:hypothetical protein